MDLPLSLDQLGVFLAVVEEGSFSAAARRLHRAQSAVSYAILNLERLLDVQLFYRSGRRPVLTEAGEAILAEARTVKLHADRLTARARSITQGLEPRISVAVDVLFPMDVFLGALAAFRERFPDVSVTLHTEALGAVSRLVADETCQIGISSPIEVFPADLDVAWLTDIEAVTVAAAGHPLAAYEPPIPLAVARAYTQLVLTDRSPHAAGVDRAVAGGSSWRLADMGTRHACLLAGFGWCNMPLHLVEGDLGAGRLVRLTLAEWPENRQIRQLVVHRRSSPPGPAARWLLAEIGRRCGNTTLAPD